MRYLVIILAIGCLAFKPSEAEHVAKAGYRVRFIKGVPVVIGEKLPANFVHKRKESIDERLKKEEAEVPKEVAR